MYHILKIFGYVFRYLGLRMKILITFIIFSGLLIGSVILLSFSNTFNDQLLDATTLNGSNEPETSHDKLLGGLLKPGFDEDSCVSRYTKSFLYRKPSPHKPSPHLVSKLRSYEMLHKRCGPGTKAYKRATEQLDANQARVSSDKECRYVVWVVTEYGLGNRIISMVSTFLYALLTDRIMLIDQRKDITDLFCEPFPDTSWLLPLDFPLMGQIDSYYKEYSLCYGTMLKTHAINSSTTIPPPSHLYLHLLHDYRDEDKMFYCQENQDFIKNVPWLVVKSNLYFAPSLWLIPSFQTKLVKLFPRKDTVFHHLSRYLFHPTNQVWDMVTSTYNANLSKADEVLGLQIRVFSTPSGYFQHVMDQIVSCTQREKLLPELATTEGSSQVMNISRTSKHKAVLLASLHPEYSDELRNMFSERPSSTGEIIEVYQPSGERVQQTDEKLHDQKALADIYLLSLTDNIVTTEWSTFGYVAQGLGGLKPWILYKPKNGAAPDPPCVRALSMEPCFIRAPLYGCQAKKIKTTPFIRRCENWNLGIKLVDAPDKFWWW